MHGQLVVGNVSESMLDRLENGMADYLAEVLPSLDFAHRFAFRLSYWAGSVQRQAGIPVSKIFWLNIQSSSESIGTTFNVALPFVKHKAASIAMNWLIDTVTELVQQTTEQRSPDPDLIREATN